jgi:endoglucanase
MPSACRTFRIAAAASALTLACAGAAPPGTATPRIAVDQFGYRPEMTKVAVISDPQTGFNAAEAYTPGTVLEVRAWGTDAVAFSGNRSVWGAGATHAQSGDKVWWFDFSALRRWGEYYIYDPATDRRSDRFRIGPEVYDPVLREAARVFFYQRRGYAKQAPFTDPKWADAASHLGPLQDTQCRPVSAPGNATLARDLRGGWFDAGDYNKYVNFTGVVLSDLLFAYEHNPLIWGDDYGIPESGNGMPDLLDEVRWELDWLLRMQNPDGSVLSKVAVSGFQSASPPSADSSQIFYGAASTSSTLCAAGSFAHGARAFAAAGDATYATALQAAAVAAWNWAAGNGSVTFSNAGFSSANPEVDAYGRSMFKLGAAIQLYALTGNTTYRTYVEGNYTASHALQWGYWYGFEPQIQDALLLYSSLPGAAPATASAIRSSKQGSMGGGEFRPAYTGATDAYRAYVKDSDYVWGSNAVKARIGQIFRQQLTHQLDTANATIYRAAADAYLHYHHGINPLSMAYLTNMYAYGGDRCANEIYHAWFGDGTPWDNALTSPYGPPPGYVPGGANPAWGGPDPSYSGPALIPPASQPVQKSYKDWNTSWPQNSWEITEPGIYYQASYVRLLSGTFRPVTYADWTEGHGLTGPDALPGADANADGVPNLAEFGFDLAPTGSNAASLPVPVVSTHVVAAQPGRYLTVTFPRRLGANLTYTVEGSTDLGSWSPVCVATGASHPTGAGFVAQNGTGLLRTVIARDTVDVAGPANLRRFLRVRVTSP